MIYFTSVLDFAYLHSHDNFINPSEILHPSHPQFHPLHSISFLRQLSFTGPIHILALSTPIFLLYTLIRSLPLFSPMHTYSIHPFCLPSTPYHFIPPHLPTFSSTIPPPSFSHSLSSPSTPLRLPYSSHSPYPPPPSHPSLFTLLTPYPPPPSIRHILHTSYTPHPHISHSERVASHGTKKDFPTGRRP